MSAPAATGSRSSPALSFRPVLFRLARMHSTLLLRATLLQILVFAVILVWGQVFRAIFDALSADAPAITSIWTWLALFVVAGAVRISAMFLASLQQTRLNWSLAGLVELNLLQVILNRPGARAVPYSPGEAVSRLLTDVDASLAGFINHLPFYAGQLILGLTAVFLLLRINVLITLALFLPMIGVGIRAQPAVILLH
jgi:ATP-binding cassette subfamily B protein